MTERQRNIKRKIKAEKSIGETEEEKQIRQDNLKMKDRITKDRKISRQEY